MQTFPKYFFGLLILLSLSNCEGAQLSENSTTATATALSCPYCELAGKDYSNQDLTDANLIKANLQGANFSGATLKGAQFNGANLQGANFNGAVIDASSKAIANFSSSDLTKATFVGAKIGKASFQFTDLTCSDFSNTNLKEAMFGYYLKYRPQEGCQPTFQNCIMDCEFPMHWSKFDLGGATMPDCDNVRYIDKDGNPMELKWKHDEIPSNKKISHVEFSLSDTYRSVGSSFPAPKDTVWVSPSGKDSKNCGSRSNPCASVEQGVAQCQSDCGVFLEVAQYQLKEKIALSNDNISIVGGFHNFQPTAYQSEIIAAPNTSSIFEGLGVRNINFSALILQGAQMQVDTIAKASSCINLKFSKGINFEYVNLIATQGSPGMPGKDGVLGGNGNNGDNGTMDKSTCKVSYGQGGAAPSCAPKGTQGGDWGISFPINYQEHPSGPGNDGDCPTAGGKAVPVTIGSYTDIWNPDPTAGPGEVGSQATSGGGGHWGGQPKWSDAACAAGGGGGSMACRGSQAAGGHAGGASFAIIMDYSTISITGSRVIIAGGKGGNGGIGGKGASGGRGGAGGAPSANLCGCSLPAGHGWAGGSGAASSGGAGGNGGPSACTVIIGQSSITNGTPVEYVGAGGNAGSKGTGGTKGQGACAAPGGEAGNTGIAKVSMTFKQ